MKLVTNNPPPIQFSPLLQVRCTSFTECFSQPTHETFPSCWRRGPGVGPGAGTVTLFVSRWCWTIGRRCPERIYRPRRKRLRMIGSRRPRRNLLRMLGRSGPWWNRVIRGRLVRSPLRSLCSSPWSPLLPARFHNKGTRQWSTRVTLMQSGFHRGGIRWETVWHRHGGR